GQQLARLLGLRRSLQDGRFRCDGNMTRGGGAGSAAGLAGDIGGGVALAFKVIGRQVGGGPAVIGGRPRWLKKPMRHIATRSPAARGGGGGSRGPRTGEKSVIGALHESTVQKTSTSSKPHALKKRRLTLPQDAPPVRGNRSGPG